MPQDFETPTSAAEYEPLPAVVLDDPSDPYGRISSPPASPASSPDSTTDVAKDQAAAVGSTAADAGKQVAGVAKDQASNVAAEAAQQTRDLVGQTRSELQDQAAQQQQRLASGIRSLSDELGSMADRSEQSGTATDLVRQASQRAHDVADWLEQRDPGSLIDEVRSFARRRPGAFLAIAAGAGLAAGRLTRGTVDASRNDSDPRADASGSSSPGPVAVSSQDSFTAYADTTSPADRKYPEPSGTGYVESSYSEPFFTDPVVEEQNQAGGRA